MENNRDKQQAVCSMHLAFTLVQLVVGILLLASLYSNWVAVSMQDHERQVFTIFSLIIV
jgi:hypothetical protein